MLESFKCLKQSHFWRRQRGELKVTLLLRSDSAVWDDACRCDKFPRVVGRSQENQEAARLTSAARSTVEQGSGNAGDHGRW